MPSDGGDGIGFHDLSSGGRVGELIRAKDWAATPLGARDSWPRSLNNYLSMILELPTAAIVFWGPNQIQLYNDGYSVIMGPRHPQHLGSTFRECWPEAYSSIHPWMQRVLGNGETVEVNRTLVPLSRFGFTEEAYFTFSFSPLRDDDGRIAGVLQLVTEVTDAVLWERRAEALRELSNLTGRAKTMQDAAGLVAEAISGSAADLPFCLVYVVDPADSQRLLLSGSTGFPPENPPPFPPVLDLRSDTLGDVPEIARAVRERTVVTMEGLTARFGGAIAGSGPEPPTSALACPIAAADQQAVVAALVGGLSPRLPLDRRYRDFMRLVCAQIGTLLNAAGAYDDERKRAEALTAIDRAKTEFFSNVSHEFRTPLTLILGPIEDALARPAGVLDAESLTQVHRSAQRLLRLVNSLLDFARLEAGRPQTSFAPTDLAALTAGLAGSFRSLAERSTLELVIECPTLPEPVYVDASQWERIVLNLVSNAYKFTLQGRIEVRLSWLGDHVELVVEDTGCGIPEAELPRVFERFHRAEGAQGRSFEGTGIGLSMVQEYVAIHGGSVTLTSREGQGSRFVVRVPTGTAHLAPDRITSQENPPEGRAAASAPYLLEAATWGDDDRPGADRSPAPENGNNGGAPAVATAGARVLVADDNADMRKYLTRILGSRWTVEAVADGEAAMEAARVRPPDLVLSDVMMPRMDGLGLLRALRAHPRTRDVPVVLLSARAGEESLLVGIETGADDYLVKPFSARELLARVNTHLAMARLRRQWAAELEAANQELDSFAHSVSHDLRSPLRAVLGFSAIVARDYASAIPERGKRLLEEIVAGAKRMDGLIEDLLRFCRVGQQALSKRPVDVAALVREVLAELDGEYKDRVDLVVGALPETSADRSLLKQVLLNLLSNAFKFTRKRERALVEIGHGEAAGSPAYFVRDNGAGFDMRYAKHLFGVFQRMHRQDEFEGTGVGLSLAHRIVQRHGGHMWAEAAVGEGATFFFTLAPDPRGGGGREEPRPAPPFGGQA